MNNYPEFCQRDMDGYINMMYPTTRSFKAYLKKDAWKEVSVRNGVSTWEKGIYHISFDVQLKRVEDKDLRVLAYIEDWDLNLIDLIWEIHAYSFHNYKEFLTHSDQRIREIAKKACNMRIQ